MSLNPCPCGETPKTLFVVCSEGISNDTPKYAYVYGGCCSEWHIEFRNDYAVLGSSESEAKAEAAWNSAPRSAQQNRGNEQ